MRVRFFIDNNDPVVHDVPIAQISDFLDLLTDLSLEKDGKIYNDESFSYNINEHAVDVICIERAILGDDPEPEEKSPRPAAATGAGCSSLLAPDSNNDMPISLVIDTSAIVSIPCRIVG